MRNKGSHKNFAAKVKEKIMAKKHWFLGLRIFRKKVTVTPDGTSTKKVTVTLAYTVNFVMRASPFLCGFDDEGGTWGSMGYG
jgi:hypothetical protein